ncbi:MAG: trigger factor [Spirochaetae bacterium HGW-Spirochaetae-7]|nr:MAG: trigger factor [Spirochaetae bacterium HGW-Spirochaetae-7]
MRRGSHVVVTKKIEKLENSSVRLTVTVGKDDVRASYEALLKEYARDVRIDGFRKGKVPSTILERKFGSQLRLDAMGRVMDQAVEKALEGETLVPLSYAQPSLEGQPSFDLDCDFSFSVAYDVFPEVNAGDVADAEIELPQVNIAKADEDRELDEIRERNAIVKDKEDGATAKRGDIATVDYSELDEAGALVPGSERQDFVFEIGTGHNLYKFDDEFIGLKKGAEKTVDKTFPADFEYAELAGQTKRLHIKLSKLKEKQLPALDDELAQDVSEKFKTLADLKADVRAKLEKRLEDRLRSLREKAIINVLVERSTVDIPASMIAAELEMRLRNLMQRMGIENEERLAQIVSSSGRSVDQLREEWRPEATKAIKTRLVMDKLVAEGKYEASEEAIAAEYAKMASESSLSVDEVKAEYERRGMVEYLSDRIKEDQLLADLEKKVKTKKGKKVAFVDLFKENE